MFQSKYLFKSINCPYYNEATNSITCERPYCQFKHPKPQHAAPANPSEDTQTNEPAACNNDSKLTKIHAIKCSVLTRSFISKQVGTNRS